jgi:hypothetical protein
MRSYRAHAFPPGCDRSFVMPNQTLSAQGQPTRSELRNPLEIVHLIETVADLQRELDQLEAQSTNVDGLHHSLCRFTAMAAPPRKAPCGHGSRRKNCDSENQQKTVGYTLTAGSQNGNSC